MRFLDSPILEDNQIKSVGTPTDPDDVVTLRLLDDLELVANVFYSFSTTSTTIPNNYIDLPIAQSVVRQDSNYNVISNTVIEITDDGDYTVSYSNAIDMISNARTNSETALFVDFNDGNGYQLIVDTVRPAYHRITAHAKDTAAMIRRPFFLTAGARVKLRARRIGQGGIFTIPNQSSIAIERLPSQRIPQPIIFSVPPADTTFENDPYTYQALASGQGITWSLANAPSGMSISTLNGLITYTPTSQGTFTNIEIIASNAGGIDSLLFDLSVIANPIPISGRIDYFRSEDLALSNGDFVSTWAGRDGNAAFLQSTSINQPEFVENLVGILPAVVFRGNEYMSGAYIGTIQPFSLVVVAIPRSSSRNTLFSYQGSVLGFVTLNRFSPQDFLATFDGNSNNNTSTNAVGPVAGLFNSPHVFVVSNNGTSIRQRIDGVNEVIYNEATPASSVTSLTIGSIDNNSISLPIEADYFEVLLYDRELTISEITTLEAFLISKYGI